MKYRNKMNVNDLTNNNHYIANIKLLKENINRNIISYNELHNIDDLGSSLIPHYFKENHLSVVALK